MSANREAERDFLYVKYFVVMVFITVAIAMVYWTSKQGIAYALFKSGGETVYGTVTVVEQNSATCFISYNFTDHNGDQHSKRKYVNRCTLLLAEKGDDISVTFSRLNPDISELTVLVPYLKSGFWVMVSGAAIFSLLCVYSIFSILQIVKHREKDRYY